MGVSDCDIFTASGKSGCFRSAWAYTMMLRLN
jgi:hypothetical protein